MTSRSLNVLKKSEKGPLIEYQRSFSFWKKSSARGLMPFGKHKGEAVDDLPSDYIKWLCASVPLREPLRSEVHRLLYPDNNNNRTTAPAVDVVKATYRELSRKYHPDRYGEQGHLAQCAINEFYERLSQGGAIDSPSPLTW